MAGLGASHGGLELLGTGPELSDNQENGHRTLHKQWEIGLLILLLVAGVALVFGYQSNDTAGPPPISDAGNAELVALVGGDLVQVDIVSGEAQEWGQIPEPVIGKTLATVSNRVVYVGESGAWALDPTHTEKPVWIAEADQVIDSGSENHVWIGMARSGDRTIDPVEWNEVDLAGNVRRSVVRAMPMEFLQPDIVWGFQSHIYRLTTQGSSKFRLINQGFPVAVGLNDLILKVCNLKFECQRRWFDTFTGEDRGPVLADVAENLVPDDQVWMSETGRYGLVSAPIDGAVELWTIATGEPVVIACDDPRSAAWSPADSFVACPSGDVVVLASTRTTQQNIVRFDSQPQDVAFYKTG